MTTDYTKIKSRIRGYYEQLYTDKVDILDERDKFLKRYSLLKLTHTQKYRKSK